jgi:DNA-binding NarL/FixJ family response regulator
MIKVLIADDHPIVRQGFKKIIEQTKDIKVSGEAANGHEAIEKARIGIFDIILLDISMPGLSGLEVLKQLRSEGIRTPILILSVYSEEQWAVRVLKSGAAGYLTKETAADELIEAIRMAAAGRRYIGASLAERLADYLDPHSGEVPHQRLSDREYTIFRLIASGKVTRQIAAELGLSISTVSTYRYRIFEKLKVSTNSELTRYAIENRLID